MNKHGRETLVGDIINALYEGHDEDSLPESKMDRVDLVRRMKGLLSSCELIERERWQAEADRDELVAALRNILANGQYCTVERGEMPWELFLLHIEEMKVEARERGITDLCEDAMIDRDTFNRLIAKGEE